MSRESLEKLDFEEVYEMLKSFRISMKGLSQLKELQNKLREHLEGSSTRKIGEVSID